MVGLQGIFVELLDVIGVIVSHVIYSLNALLSHSYPALLSVPTNTGDDNLHRLARCYRHNRVPVITWRHPRTKALLMRGAGFHGKGVMSMLKGPPTTTSTCISSSL